MRYVLVLLALAGIVVSYLALRVHYGTESAPCSINEKWDCGIVNHSPYAEVRGVPVAAIGIAGYFMIAILALLRRRWLLMAVVAGGTVSVACAGSGADFLFSKSARHCALARC